MGITTWHPFATVARRREQLLGLRIADLERLLVAERAQTAYFRDRYDRLADLVLYRQVEPGAVSPVHVEPRPSDPAANVVARIGRVATHVGGLAPKKPLTVTHVPPDSLGTLG